MLDASAQGTIWRKIASEFKILLLAHQENCNLSYDELKDIVKTYDDVYSNLPFMGKTYVVVNPRFLTGLLTGEIHLLHYEEIIAQRGNGKCNCQIRFEFNISPLYDYQLEAGQGTDGYYIYDFYICRICAFKWVSYPADDSRGDLIFDKWNDSDYPLQKIYSKQEILVKYRARR